MQELDYNPSKKDLTDARIHHLLAEELKPYRRVSFWGFVRRFFSIQAIQSSSLIETIGKRRIFHQYFLLFSSLFLYSINVCVTNYHNYKKIIIKCVKKILCQKTQKIYLGFRCGMIYLLLLYLAKCIFLTFSHCVMSAHFVLYIL